MGIGLISFAFAQGILTFFSPCSVSLLPGYIAYVVGKEEQESKLNTLRKGLYVGLSASLGFFVVFISLGLLVAFASNLVGKYLSWIQLVTGLAILFLGVTLLLGLGKKLTFSSRLRLFSSLDNTKQGFIPFFLYGIGYAVSALGCTFPLFLATVLQALGSGGVIGASIIFITYAFGMSVLMVGVSVFSKELIRKKINQFMPYVTKISGAVLILAGLYLINFAWTVIKITQ